MNANLLDPEHDPMGAAIADYFHHRRRYKLRVLSSQFDEDEIPVKTLFRTLAEMPPLEQQALRLAHGKILDVGAGSGCHTLALMEMGQNEVTAIDISPLSVQTMQERGIRDARQINLFDASFTERFDTLLMLMNGSGIIGKLRGMNDFFSRLRDLLLPGGSVLLDSSDLKYLYEEEDDSSDIDPTAPYYGEVDYQMRYGTVSGEPFDWLYVDFATLQMYAEGNGFTAELVAEGEHYDYLARLSVRS
jgi:hypothetical protein